MFFVFYFLELKLCNLSFEKTNDKRKTYTVLLFQTNKQNKKKFRRIKMNLWMDFVRTKSVLLLFSRWDCKVDRMLNKVNVWNVVVCIPMQTNPPKQAGTNCSFRNDIHLRNVTRCEIETMLNINKSHIQNTL